MLTLKEAIKIAEMERNSKVVCANDCGDRWAFGFEDDENKTDGIPLFVYKIDGNVEYFLSGMLVDSLENGEITCNPIQLPT